MSADWKPRMRLRDVARVLTRLNDDANWQRVYQPDAISACAFELDIDGGILKVGALFEPYQSAPELQRNGSS